MQGMLAIAHQRGIEVRWADLGERHGEYVDGVVTIHEDRPEEVQRIILAHELGHAALNHHPTRSRWTRELQEREADKHAAMLLVARLAHERAERLYGPSIGAVAAELEMPTRIVEALREIT